MMKTAAYLLLLPVALVTSQGLLDGLFGGSRQSNNGGGGLFGGNNGGGGLFGGNNGGGGLFGGNNGGGGLFGGNNGGGSQPTTFVGNIIDVPAIVRGVPADAFQGLFGTLGPLIAGRLNQPGPADFLAQISSTGILSGIGKPDNHPQQIQSSPLPASVQAQSQNNRPAAVQAQSPPSGIASLLRGFSLSGAEGNDRFSLSTQVQEGGGLRISGSGFDF